MRSPRSGADGVVGIAEVFRNALFRRFHYRPPRPLLYKEASRLLLDVASTPPESGGEWRSPSFVLDQRNTRGHRPRLQSISRFCNALISGGDLPAQFIHSCFDPAYRHYVDRLLNRRGGRELKKKVAKQPYCERTGWSFSREFARFRLLSECWKQSKPA